MTVQYKLELLKAQLGILLNDFVRIQTSGGGRGGKGTLFPDWIVTLGEYGNVTWERFKTKFVEKCCLTLTGML